jgi:hypothetical protein
MINDAGKHEVKGAAVAVTLSASEEVERAHLPLKGGGRLPAQSAGNRVGFKVGFRRVASDPLPNPECTATSCP